MKFAEWFRTTGFDVLARNHCEIGWNAAIAQARTIRHTGIVVQDLPAAIKHWESLGFEQHIICIEDSKFMDALMGLTGAVVTTVKMRAKDCSMIELLHIPSHPAITGITHVALTVDKLDEGVISPDGKVKVAYVRVPWCLLELVEELC